MIFKTEIEAVSMLKANLKVTPKFVKMREQSRELKALVNGDGFLDELIIKIEGIESPTRAKAREMYSRDVQDLFSRLFQPIENIYYATGGVKDYDIKNEAVKTKFLHKIANVRDNKPLSEWVQGYGTQLMNTDPNGVLFLEYKTTPDLDVYPTYKSIDSIRYYEASGQVLDFIIFEPKLVNNSFHWRIVDDLTDRTFKQEGLEFVLIEELTFNHPFGNVPALVCSNISRAGSDIKLPAINSVLGTVKEYARDQSFLTLYKIYKGNPIFWKYVQYCGECSGTGNISGESCTTCNGHGKMVSKNDVTDAAELPIPDNNESPIIAPNIAGFISPDLDVWTKYEETLRILEEQIYKSHWGTNYGMHAVQGMKTATEVEFDKQPLENQLNKYADFVEFIEWRFSEWILNLYDVAKDRNESLVTVNLGRRYIIESYDVLLERYEKAVLNEDNSVILDKTFVEYLSAKYRNNPIDLQTNLLKAKIEPYLHLSLKNTSLIFGNLEAQRKVLFSKWWSSVKDFTKEPDFYTKEFGKWFELNKKEDRGIEIKK